jgi:hypothetical protein
VLDASECTVCGVWIKFDDQTKTVRCPECETEYVICTDAEFVNGVWRNRTMLLPIGKPKDYEKDLADEKTLLYIGLLVIALSLTAVFVLFRYVL